MYMSVLKLFFFLQSITYIDIMTKCNYYINFSSLLLH